MKRSNESLPRVRRYFDLNFSVKVVSVNKKSNLLYVYLICEAAFLHAKLLSYIIVMLLTEYSCLYLDSLCASSITIFISTIFFCRRLLSFRSSSCLHRSLFQCGVSCIIMTLSISKEFLSSFPHC